MPIRKLLFTFTYWRHLAWMTITKWVYIGELRAAMGTHVDATWMTVFRVEVPDHCKYINYSWLSRATGEGDKTNLWRAILSHIFNFVASFSLSCEELTPNSWLGSTPGQGSRWIGNKGVGLKLGRKILQWEFEQKTGWCLVCNAKQRKPTFLRKSLERREEEKERS